MQVFTCEGFILIKDSELLALRKLQILTCAGAQFGKFTSLRSSFSIVAGCGEFLI